MPTLNETRIAELTEMGQNAGLDQVFYRFFDCNLGSAAGHNVLLSDFAADLLLIINPDTAASPYLLNEMLLRMGDSAYGFGDIGIVEARADTDRAPQGLRPGKWRDQLGHHRLRSAAPFGRQGGRRLRRRDLLLVLR